jgi:hypothetical protein
MVASMKSTTFWDFWLCGLVEAGQCLIDAYCLHYHRDDEPLITSETLVSFYETTWCKTRKDIIFTSVDGGSFPLAWTRLLLSPSYPWL